MLSLIHILSGVEAAYKTMKKLGRVKDNFKFIAFGGDGGTYDIGMQSLSGAMERGHDMVYVCYDNEAYMNTGIQRSSSTPRFADATTSPAGIKIPGKIQNKKDLTSIIAAHNIPYAAQTTFRGNFKDLHEKAHKAIYTAVSYTHLPNYRQRMKEYSSGYLTVPAVGAGTANVEFEVMTGISVKFFGPGEYPYKEILRKTTCETTPNDLKTLG